MASRREFLGAAASLTLGPHLLRAAEAEAAPPARAPVGNPQANDVWLLVDDHHVLYRAGTRRAFHPPTRHPSNPLLRGLEKPWEYQIGYCTVHHDARRGRYQLWYQAYAGERARERTHRCVVCYAESRDGITWEKPNLGLHRFNDVKDTNIVLLANGGFSDRYGACVVYDPRDADAERRYKMGYFDFSVADDGKEYPGLSAAFSPDGVRWTKHPKAPLLKVAYADVKQPPYADDREHPWEIPLSMSDAVDIVYDPRRAAFIWYGKMWIDGPDGRMVWKHGTGRTQSKDFLEWSRPELVLTPDDLDPAWVEFHTTPVFVHGGVYFATLQILNRAEGGGVLDVELAVSRDGLRWDRPFRKPFFLPRGASGAFDAGSLFTNCTPVVLENEIRFYYGGYAGGATSDLAERPSGIGLASLRRDRFAGVRPTGEVGQITLKPVELQDGDDIRCNADASAAAGGRVLPELLDASGRRVRGFTRDDAVPITGDSLSHAVRWKPAASSRVPAGRYMLRLHLRDAEVFAVSFPRGSGHDQA
jgi:hypothetical protein